MHVFAYWIVANYAEASSRIRSRQRWSVITGTLLLAWSLLLSQAMESVTRAFYSRSDLDLILTSPALRAQSVCGAHRHALRRRRSLMAVLLAAPFINVLAVLRRRALARAPMASWPRWARWRRRLRWR